MILFNDENFEASVYDIMQNIDFNESLIKLLSRDMFSHHYEKKDLFIDKELKIITTIPTNDFIGSYTILDYFDTNLKLDKKRFEDDVYETITNWNMKFINNDFTIFDIITHKIPEQYVSISDYFLTLLFRGDDKLTNLSRIDELKSFLINDNIYDLILRHVDPMWPEYDRLGEHGLDRYVFCEHKIQIPKNFSKIITDNFSSDIDLIVNNIYKCIDRHEYGVELDKGMVKYIIKTRE